MASRVATGVVSEEEYTRLDDGNCAHDEKPLQVQPQLQATAHIDSSSATVIPTGSTVCPSTRHWTASEKVLSEVELPETTFSVISNVIPAVS